MREILFRGQTRRLGEKVRMNGEKVPGNWVYGGIFHGKGDFSIVYGRADVDLTVGNLEKHVVYSDTVGQYTGLTDKNGKKIFEGDILKGLRYHDYGQCGEFEPCQAVVTWDVEESRFYPFHLFDGYTYDLKTFEIIGNIHDNPELLKGGEGNG